MGKHLCSGCSEAIYCSKECQKTAWKDHKTVCNQTVKPTSVTSFDILSAKQLKNILKVKAANFDSVQKKKIMDQLDSIIEKQQLVKLVEEHVKLSEVESLLTAADATLKASSSSSSSSASKSLASKKANKAATNTNYPPTPTPDQLRQQAVMIRKDPAMVRKANAALANMSDDQIRAYADQLEQAASDPNMMKEVERMSRLSPAEREQLQLIQEGLQGIKPMDEPWINTLVGTLKKNPEFFKTMIRGKAPATFGGVSEDSVMQFIDTAATMDASTLRRILQFLLYLSSWSKPATDAYTQMDKMTFGCARYILLAIVGLILYFSVAMWIRIGSWVLYKLFGWPALAAAPVGATVAGASSAASSLAKATTTGGVSVTTALPKAAAEAVAAAGVGLAASALSSAAAGIHADVGNIATDKMWLVSDDEDGVPPATTTEGGKKPLAAAAVASDGEAADAEFNF